MTTQYGRILSVDSQLSFRKEIVNYLEDSGFTLYEASNGADALEVFREKKPDLVLSAHPMPVGELELFDLLKKESPDTPFVVISDGKTVADLVQVLRLGAWDYVIKPVTNMAVLEHVVCRALERGRLVIENKKYRLALEEKNSELTESLTQLEEDQKAGKSVQEQLLPSPSVQYDHYRFTYKILPSLYLSGDFVDYFLVEDEKMAFYIADVSGHGASSAFVTILLRNIIRQALGDFQKGASDIILKPHLVLKEVNDCILNAKLGKYLTMVYGLIDMKKNHLRYSVGGHYPSPVVWNGETNSTAFLEGEGIAIGIVEEPEFKSYDYPLPSIFTIALFSDGVLEMIQGRSLKEKEKILLSLPLSKEIEPILAPLIKNQDHLPDDLTLLLINRM